MSTLHLLDVEYRCTLIAYAMLQCLYQRGEKNTALPLFFWHQWINKYNWTLSVTKLTRWWELYVNWANQSSAFHRPTLLSAHKYAKRHDHTVPGRQSLVQQASSFYQPIGIYFTSPYKELKASCQPPGPITSYKKSCGALLWCGYPRSSVQPYNLVSMWLLIGPGREADLG